MKGTLTFTKCIKNMRTFQLLQIKRALIKASEDNQDPLIVRQLEILDEQLKERDPQHGS